MGLLESSPHLQMVLIDLKGGLEMIDFKNAPNVIIIKDMPEAVKYLRSIQLEMKRRFDYLQKKGRKKIDPAKDKLDRIVVGIDEASVLYMQRKNRDREYELSIEARAITDEIAKLSRAAAIHLIFATQKVTSEVIPTSIQDNISARMCFKVNSVPGSSLVVGDKEAMDLPKIPGRGIWLLGTERESIQAPFIEEKEIKARCESIKEEFQLETRKMLSPKIGLKQYENTVKKREKLSLNFQKDEKLTNE